MLYYSMRCTIHVHVKREIQIHNIAEHRRDSAAVYRLSRHNASTFCNINIVMRNKGCFGGSPFRDGLTSERNAAAKLLWEHLAANWTCKQSCVDGTDDSRWTIVIHYNEG
ncbi:uncharacterized protein LOC116427506 [Nomia melanderi]|uniref:uncharacterized protein LOC116427506 n=1 Tax=Nomia melanderi TaxID=2448451 RepID=UPI003FCE4B8D